ncbi:von Willebrand factor type A domain-containing protein [Cellulomonas sp. DKR-3]|uniref:von Willebrand factor type A domain-containing protein n=1 Tax=Cellulomonas fulva TaxID=2835530 RepID=A0ABS5TY90_9CELL|nr:von Willebrand factor type A domain-containing protein [Cellulomonas fulva]MBT0994087.1 von Willebrand factor type A domain-containing protein [Cellulomonas fulva]
MSRRAADTEVRTARGARPGGRPSASVRTFAAALAVALVGALGACTAADDRGSATSGMDLGYDDQSWREAPLDDQEEYDDSPEQPFQDVTTSPLSTFASDVDTASYSNLRRQLRQGVAPEGIRIEELVNYFDYDYPAPAPDAADPFTVTTQVADAPWASGHQLAMIGVQATETTPTTAGNNVVFLLDVSGSMDEPNKLPLLAQSFELLVEQLDEDDTVSIVTYAGSDQVLADSVPADRRGELVEILRNLEAGGSTGGAHGLETAYELATENFVEGGNNRVILATDGDFNVGPSTPAQLTDLIEDHARSGVYISVLGFGMGNLKDSTMEAIADHGNGNYAYIDTLDEARKVLVDEFDSTMFVVAQDLKVQVELNPATVSRYRLLGYDNRRLEDEEFDDDTTDAGDVGAGHEVTAFYELIPAEGAAPEDGLRYQDVAAGDSTDYLTVHVRYKHPGEDASAEVVFPAGADAYTSSPTSDFTFAAAVVEFALVASGSQHAGDADTGRARERASSAVGEDPYGLRSEFVDLIGDYQRLVG